MRTRICERIVKENIRESGEFMNDKLAKSFQDTVRKVGIPFRVYEASIHGRAQIGFSALTGRHWRTFLAKFPAILRASSGVLSEERANKFATLYEEFNAALTFAGKCGKEDGERVSEMTQAWTRKYLYMAPYLHLFHAHLGKSVSLLGGQDRLSGELVELANDALKKTHLRKTNRLNPSLTLRNQLRIEHHEREEAERKAQAGKRKKKSQHPSCGENTRRREKENRAQEEERRREATEALKSRYSHLSDQDLKNEIRRRTGKRTQKRGRDALLTIMCNLDDGGEINFSVGKLAF